jgi:gas vesicle protein
MSKGKFALGAMLGAAIGVVAGFLTAPKSGKQTRAELKAKATNVQKDVTEKAKVSADKATEAAMEAKEKAQMVAKDVTAQAEELKRRTGNAVEGAKKGFYKK